MNTNSVVAIACCIVVIACCFALEYRVAYARDRLSTFEGFLREGFREALERHGVPIWDDSKGPYLDTRYQIDAKELPWISMLTLDGKLSKVDIPSFLKQRLQEELDRYMNGFRIGDNQLAELEADANSISAGSNLSKTVAERIKTIRDEHANGMISEQLVTEAYCSARHAIENVRALSADPAYALAKNAAQVRQVRAFANGNISKSFAVALDILEAEKLYKAGEFAKGVDILHRNY